MDTAPAVGVNYFQYKNFFLTFLQAVVTAEATVVEEATLNSPAAMAAATNKAEATKRILSLSCGFHLPFPIVSSTWLTIKAHGIKL